MADLAFAVLLIASFAVLALLLRPEPGRARRTRPRCHMILVTGARATCAVACAPRRRIMTVRGPQRVRVLYRPTSSVR